MAAERERDGKMTAGEAEDKTHLQFAKSYIFRQPIFSQSCHFKCTYFHKFTITER